MSGAQLSALLPQVVVGLTVLLLLVADSFVPEDRKAILAWLAAGGFVTALVAAGAALPGPPSGEQLLFNDTLAVDAFSLFFQVLFLGLGLLVLMIAPGYLDRRGIQRGEFYILLAAALAGMMVLVAATNLMTIFIGIELLSLALYVLAGFLRTEERSQEAALKYLLIGGFASGFLLYGMALIYGGTGSTSVPRISAVLAHLSGDSLLFSAAGAGLVLVGLAFKASAAPFHSWTPDVYEGAPAPVVAFMAVGTKIAAVAVFLRVFVAGFGPAIGGGRWTILLGAVAALSMVVGSVGALRQAQLKRLLAYSSIAQAGYLLLAAVDGTQQAMVSGLYYLGAYAVMTFGAFAVVTLLSGPGADAGFHAIRGLGFRKPLLGLCLTIFMASLAGFPPTLGFWAKLFLFDATIRAGFTSLALVAVVASAISLYYYLQVIAMVYTRPDPAAAPVEAEPVDSMGTLATVLTGIATLGLGIFPGILYGMAQRSTLL